MTQEEQLSKHIDNYFVTRKNKRYGRDSSEYEVNWVANLVRSVRERDDRTFRIRHNYAFLVSRPRWREIFATEFDGRLADHELCDLLMPYIEFVLSPRTYNNRKGKGTAAAINQVIKDMVEVSENFTKRAWIIKFDLKGFFPNANCDYIQQCFDKVIDEYIASEDEREYLHWLTMICVHSNPAEHCELRTPPRLWKEHIPNEKSLFHRPPGIGTPIGRLTSQTGMGMYINDEIRWVNEDCGIRLSVFVDDGVMIVPEEKKDYALFLLGELRKRLLVKGVVMNEKKFYCQPIVHGLEFLGSHLRPHRIHLNNCCYNRAMSTIKDFNKAKDKFLMIDKLVQSVNSYTGQLKGKNDHKRLIALRNAIDPEYWQWLWWSDTKNCLQYQSQYSVRERLNKKYHLKLKNHDKGRN